MQDDYGSGSATGGSDERSDKPRSRKTKILIWVHAIMFAAGLALLGYLIYRIGYQSILESVSRVGWGFILIIGLNLARHMLRAMSLYIAIAPEHRNFKYRNAVSARLGGEAVSFFSFVGPFLGDATKAVLLRKDLPLTHGASAIISDNILYYVTVVIVVLGGVITLVFTFGSNSPAMSNVLIGTVVLSLLCFAVPLLAIKYRVLPVTFLMELLERRDLAPRFLSTIQNSFSNVEKNVVDFYHNRRADFFTVFGISLGVHIVSVAEVFMALRFLGLDAYVSTAFIIESLTKVINAAFGFIPGTIGVYEGGNGLILSTLGYTAAAGVSLALVRRAAILFSTFLGMLILLWRTAGRGARHLARKREKAT